MQAIYICSLFFVVIFLPISIKLQGVLSDGKFYFSSSIYSVSLLGGYAQINGKNLNIHISNKRAISLKVANLIEKRNTFNKISGFSLYSFKSCLISDVKSFIGLTACVFVSIIREVVSPIIVERIPWLEINNDILFVEDDGVRYVMQLKCWANLYCFISFAVKSIIEGVRNEKGKQSKY